MLPERKMSATRRNLLKLGALAGIAGATGLLSARETRGADAKPAKALDILILGGTGFTGPHQVRYALARGHKITLFNRGKHPRDFGPDVEELTGDRAVGDLKSLEGKRTWDVCIDNPTSVPSRVRDA